MFGVGAGVALAVGLKYKVDTAEAPGDGTDKEAPRTNRYSDAIDVSRDLVERIKVGSEVGTSGVLSVFDPQSSQLHVTLH